MDSKKLEYVEHFAGKVLGIPVKALSDKCDLIFREISGIEDIEKPKGDRLRGLENVRNDFYEVQDSNFPWIDDYLMQVKENEVKSVPELKFEPLWPGNKKFALCLTHDVDFVSRKQNLKKAFRRLHFAISGNGPRKIAIKKSAGSIIRILSELSKPDIMGHFEDWLKVEDRYGFHSTFFFFPSNVSNANVYDCDYKMNDSVIYNGKKIAVSEMIREIRMSGWEIGLHASYEAFSSQKMVADQKKQIEIIINSEITSIRHHFLKYDISKTPRYQFDSGFLCDSTIGFNNSIGFRAGTSFPFNVWDQSSGRELPLLEIPLVIMDGGLFTTELGGVRTEKEAIKYGLTIMDKVEKVGGCLTLNWHPHNLIYPVYFKTYLALLDEASRRNAWGCSAGELCEWWTNKELLLRKRNQNKYCVEI